MNYEILVNNNNTIINNLHLLKGNINKLKRKILILNKLNSKLSKNKILDNNHRNSFLFFQVQILNNECVYYQNLYKTILKKYFEEVLELSKYIIVVLISFNKLEIDNNYEKNAIYNKIINLKKYKNINYGNLNDLINITINNLKLIDDFMKLFDKFTKVTLKNNLKNNIHNNTFEENIVNKYKSIILEYEKYSTKFTKLIDYFKKCSSSIIQQIESSDLLKFFLTNKSI